MVLENVRAECKKQGLSLRYVERESGLSNGAISKWKNSMPASDNLQAVANVLGVKTEFLLRNEEQNKKGGE